VIARYFSCSSDPFWLVFNFGVASQMEDQLEIF